MRKTYTIIYIGTDVFPISQCGAVERLLFGENLKKFNNGGNHMSKKLISVMLALVMVLSVFSISAFAVDVGYEDPDAEEGYYQLWYLETTNEPDANGNYTVDVYLEANYYVGAISFHIDAVGATLSKVEASDFIMDNEDYNANVQPNKAKGNVYIIPEATDATALGLDFTDPQLVATLTYTLTAESATITLNNDAKTIGHDGKLIATRLGDNVLSSNTMYYGQFVNDIEYNEPAIGEVISEVTLGEEVAADPVLNGVGTGVVDTENGCVYGVLAGTTDFTEFFTVENGTFEMVANDNGYKNGTGATLVVKNNANEEFATYTLVIFGDVNGDAAITAADSNLAKMAALGATIESDAANLAANVNGDDSITAADSNIIKMAALGGNITVNPFAA